MSDEAKFDEALAAERKRRGEQFKRDRRERIATAVLAAVLAGTAADGGWCGDDAVKSAIEWTDALIAALDAEAGDDE